MTEQKENYETKITFKNGRSMTIKGARIDFQSIIENELDKILVKGSPDLWVNLENVNYMQQWKK